MMSRNPELTKIMAQTGRAHHAETQPPRIVSPDERDTPTLLHALIDQMGALNASLERLVATQLNRDDWGIVVIPVPDSTSIVAGPDIPIPDGHKLVIRMRRHSGSPTGYVARTSEGTGNTLDRSELKDNDTIELKVNNLKLCRFGSDSSSTVYFELFVEGKV